MERLKQLTEKLNRQTLEGASKEALLEIGFEIIYIVNRIFFQMS